MGILLHKLLQQPCRRHDHFGTGPLGVKFRRPGRGVGVRRGIFQNLPADDAAVLRPEGRRQLLDLAVEPFLADVITGVS